MRYGNRATSLLRLAAQFATEKQIDEVRKSLKVLMIGGIGK